MTYRAVVFDLDGTLLDSLEDLADAMNTVLDRHGFPRHPLQAYRHFIGEGVEMLVRRALPGDPPDEGTVARCLGDMRAEYERRSTQKTRPYPGVPELLDALADRGVPTAILTNKPHEATLAMVPRLLGRWRFEAVFGVCPGLPRKPDPTGALRIARTLGIPPAEWLYLGDTATDMLTANAAGMCALGALWGFREAEELRAAGARFLLESPLDLLPHLG